MLLCCLSVGWHLAAAFTLFLITPYKDERGTLELLRNGQNNGIGVLKRVFWGGLIATCLLCNTFLKFKHSLYLITLPTQMHAGDRSIFTSHPVRSHHSQCKTFFPEAQDRLIICVWLKARISSGLQKWYLVLTFQNVLSNEELWYRHIFSLLSLGWAVLEPKRKYSHPPLSRLDTFQGLKWVTESTANSEPYTF